MNLHDVTPRVITQLIWCRPLGGNDRPIGDNYAHLYRIERGIPTEMQPRDVGDWMHYARRRWAPFDTHLLENDFIITPLCGRLRTRARHAYLNTWNVQQNCPRCEALAPGAGLLMAAAHQNDPWQQIPWDARAWTPDPLTGR